MRKKAGKLAISFFILLVNKLIHGQTPFNLAPFSYNMRYIYTGKNTSTASKTLVELKNIEISKYSNIVHSVSCALCFFAC